MPGPLVSLLTDFGLADPSVPICKGVILRIAPEAQLLDVSHEVRRYSIAHGAALLWAALPYLPIGVHLAVVDPGVGTERRPIAIATGRGDRLVGPDNGLLVPGAERLGGIVACHLLEREEYRLAPVSRTFHGRDIFAPAAAHLAAGVPIERLGPSVDPASLVRLAAAPPEVGKGGLVAEVAFVDTFGNLQLRAAPADLAAALGPLAPGDRLLASRGGEQSRRPGAADGALATWQLSFGDVEPGETLLCEDSAGRLALAVNQGNAAARYGLEAGGRLHLRRA